MSNLKAGGAGGALSSQPPPWVEDVDAVNEVLGDIQRQMDQLHSMHATRVGSVFGKDLDNMEGQIEKMTRDITDAFRYAERLLKKVGVATKRAGGEEAQVGANVQRRFVHGRVLSCRVCSNDIYIYICLVWRYCLRRTLGDS